MSNLMPKEDRKDGRKERAGSASCNALFSAHIFRKQRVASRANSPRSPYRLADWPRSFPDIGTGYLYLSTNNI